MGCGGKRWRRAALRGGGWWLGGGLVAVMMVRWRWVELGVLRWVVVGALVELGA